MRLPRAGMTLLLPWPLFILYSNKRTENRSAGVARRIGTWRGLVAFGVSRNIAGAPELLEAVCSEPWFRWGPAFPGMQWRETVALCGHLVGVAELLDVRPNGPHPTDPWAVPGEHGLHLGRVWRIEPIPCSGGRGVHAIGGCASCGHVGAIDERGAPLRCLRCRAVTPRPHLVRPALRVLQELDAHGAAVDHAA